ncbi:MAG TPA: AmmeMemoRadiSam system protein A [Pelolinea sp.]|nr:AmmeMemoRadiSam system protein A [Pelolinea sp.]
MEKNKDSLTSKERKLLLEIARDAIQSAVKKKPFKKIDPNSLPEKLRTDGVSFITLTISGRLRGCIGALEAFQPLAVDVQEHAAAAATEDYRFPPVSEEELPLLEIEISRLTPTAKIAFDSPNDLLNKIRPGVDGVVIKDGMRRATFLPQVWEKVSTPDEFFAHLCIKMGAHPDLWREKNLDVFTYQVEKFKE